MTVLSQHSSTPSAPPIPSALRIVWRARRQMPLNPSRTETIRITAVANPDGTIVVATEHESGHDAARTFNADCTTTTLQEGAFVVSWDTPTERLIRACVSVQGEVLAMRSAIPTALGLPGGTYCQEACASVDHEDTSASPM